MIKPVRSELPSAFGVSAEPNKYLKRFKGSLQRRFRLTRSNELFEAVDLAYYLLALDRHEEALEIVSFLSNAVEFNGDYKIWTPVGCAIILESRLHRLLGNPGARKATLEKVIMNPYRTPLKKEELSRLIAEGIQDLGAARREKSQKWSCHILSRALMSLCFLSETSEWGFEHSQTYDNKDIESLMDEALQLLKERLS